MTRDPRFDELSGTFNQEKFEKAYSFLDEVKANEKKVRIITNFRHCVMIKIICNMQDYSVNLEVERLLNNEYQKVSITQSHNVPIAAKNLSWCKSVAAVTLGIILLVHFVATNIALPFILVIKNLHVMKIANPLDSE